MAWSQVPAYAEITDDKEINYLCSLRDDKEYNVKFVQKKTNNRDQKLWWDRNCTWYRVVWVETWWQTLDFTNNTEIQHWRLWYLCPSLFLLFSRTDFFHTNVRKYYQCPLIVPLGNVVASTVLETINVPIEIWWFLHHLSLKSEIQ